MGQEAGVLERPAPGGWFRSIVADRLFPLEPRVRCQGFGSRQVLPACWLAAVRVEGASGGDRASARSVR